MSRKGGRRREAVTTGLYTAAGRNIGARQRGQERLQPLSRAQAAPKRSARFSSCERSDARVHATCSPLTRRSARCYRRGRAAGSLPPLSPVKRRPLTPQRRIPGAVFSVALPAYCGTLCSKPFSTLLHFFILDCMPLSRHGRVYSRAERMILADPRLVFIFVFIVYFRSLYSSLSLRCSFLALFPANRSVERFERRFDQLSFGKHCME